MVIGFGIIIIKKIIKWEEIRSGFPSSGLFIAALHDWTPVKVTKPEQPPFCGTPSRTLQ